MKNAISLRKFIETFNVKPFEIYNNKLSNLSELPWNEAYKLNVNGAHEERTCLRVSEDSIYFCRESFYVRRIGNRFFKEKNDITSERIYITPKQIYLGKHTTFGFVREFLNLIGISEWYKDISHPVVSHYFIKPTILRAVITKKIYNEELFYKFIGNRCFGTKNIGWRYIKKYFYLIHIKHCHVSLNDLIAFTKNAEDSINVLYNTTDFSLYTDLLFNAVKLNQIVDFTWSNKRLVEEHQKQIETITESEIADKEDKPLFKDLVEQENIKVLNTEREVFMEAKTMHHCLYSCYFKRMKNGTYMAFHMTGPEDCTFSISFANDEIYLDQIHLKYNAMVSPWTKEAALDFIKKNNDQLIKCFKNRQQKQTYEDLEEIPDLPLWNEDLVF